MDGSFEEYVNARGGALLRFAYVLSGDCYLAEDLVQEVLARVHQRWERMAGVEQPDAYLRTAVVRQFLSWRRRLSSRERPLASPPERPATGADPAASQAARDEIWRLLATLPGKQRAVLVLRFYEDLPDPEIADVLGCRQATVRVHASRGLTRLRGLLQSSRHQSAHVEYLELTHGHPDRRTTFMSVRIHSEDPSRWFATVGFDIDEQETTVRGQDALLATGVSDESVPDEVPDNRVAAVSWSYEPGQWVSVLGHNGFGADEVLRYAEELTEQPFPAQPAFTFDLLPPGAEPTSVTSSGMSFAPAGAGAVDFRQDGMPIPRELLVRLRTGPVDEDLVFDCYLRTEDHEQCEDLAREPVQVGDHDGELVGTGTVVVYLGDEVSLTVTVGGDFSLSREDLLRLAAGIHLTEYAQPAGGA